MRELKVYGWVGYTSDPRSVNRHGRHQVQTRCVMAARSVAEVVRVSGIPRNQIVANLATTGNPREIEVAMVEPGTVFWKALDASRDGEWFRLGDA